jgi:hypothetical protein
VSSKRTIQKSTTAFLGKRVVFTGKLASMTRREAGHIVREAGGEVQAGVSRHTSLVVIGMEGWPLLPDGKISNKLKLAEEINKIFGSLQIISESAFLALAGLLERKCELRKTYSSTEVCRLLRIEPEVLQRQSTAVCFTSIRPRRGRRPRSQRQSMSRLSSLIDE